MRLVSPEGEEAEATADASVAATAGASAAMKAATSAEVTAAEARQALTSSAARGWPAVGGRQREEAATVVGKVVERVAEATVAGATAEAREAEAKAAEATVVLMAVRRWRWGRRW